MKILEQNVLGIKKLVMDDNWDWVHVNAGGVGTGKSTLGAHMCKIFDPTFYDEDNLWKVVFSPNQFYKAISKSQSGDAILCDEGLGLFYSRDFSKKENKDIQKVLTLIRDHNIFFCISVSDYFALDIQLRRQRIKSACKVGGISDKHRGKIRRGVLGFYSRHQLKYMKKSPMGDTWWPYPDFQDYFPKLKNDWWFMYNKKKKKYQTTEKDEALATTQDVIYGDLSKLAREVNLHSSTLSARAIAGRLPAIKIGARWKYLLENKAKIMKILGRPHTS